MESSGTTPRGSVTAPDLAKVAQAEGPFATVYLSTESQIENAAQLSEQHWKTLRAQLAEEGAAEEALAAIDPLVPDAHLHGECLAAIANRTGLLHTEYGPEPLVKDIGRWSALPSLLPVVAWRQSSPAHVALVADRQGADLFAFRREGPDLHREAGGADYPLTKPNPGGWAQLRYQHRAENTWERNAENVAEELMRLASRVQARVVVAAGDVRALEMLQSELPAEIREIFQVVEGGRQTERASIDEISEHIRSVVDGAVAADTDALMSKLREELGENDRAVEGAKATIRALSMAQVDTLLMQDDRLMQDDVEQERLAYFGSAPTQLALRPEELHAMGVDSPGRERLVDIVLRAALGTGAGVRVVPAEKGPAEGLGAILRWSSA